MRRIRAAVAMAALLAGCTAGPDYRRPVLDLPASFPEDSAVPAAATPLPPSDWWRLYQDPLLDELVAATLSGNADLAQALARIDEADAVLRQANASLLPGLDLGAQAGRQALSNAAPTPRVNNGIAFTLSAAWELDFRGRVRRNVESAEAALRASRYAHDAVALSLAAATTQAYFTVRALDALIGVTQDSLQSFDASVSLTRRRSEGGVASDLDLRLAEVQRQTARVQSAELARQRALALHQLQNLTGRLDLSVAEQDLRTLPLPALPPAGLPSELLERRPDVRQAEAALAAQNARIGVARAAMFPSISLTGDYGGQSSSLATLLSAPGRIWSIGFGLALPLFDAGRREAVTALEEARTREAIGAYQKSLQNAFRDVQDALASLRYNRDAQTDVRLRVEAADAALRLAQRRYDAGYSSYLDVLVAQRTLYDAQTGAVQNRQAVMLASVDLFKALGGGWDAGAASGSTAAQAAPAPR
jgi:multidrug efflux system outer membrane protein